METDDLGFPLDPSSRKEVERDIVNANEELGAALVACRAENERLRAGITVFADEMDGDGYGDWAAVLRKLVTP